MSVFTAFALFAIACGVVYAVLLGIKPRGGDQHGHGGHGAHGGHH